MRGLVSGSWLRRSWTQPTLNLRGLLTRVHCLRGYAAAGDVRAVVFFNQLLDLAISDFYTSEMGTRDLSYIGNEPQIEWKGCPTSALANLGV